MAQKLTLTLTLLILIFLPTQQAQADSITNYNPTSHWELEEASGTRLDSTASNNDLTDNNTVASINAHINDGADFERSNSEYLSIVDASQTGLDFLGDFSLSMWVKLEQLPSTAGGDMELISKAFGSGDSGYRIFITSADKIALYYWTAVEDVTDITTQAVFDAGDVGVWVHIVVTIDVSESTGNFVYKDATTQSMTYDGVRVTSIANSSNPFMIGRYSNGATNYFDGVIDEVSVWGGVELTSTQITAIYNSGTGLCYATCTPPEEPPATTSSSTSTTTFEDDNILFMLAMIIFFMAFSFTAQVFAIFKKANA